MSADLEERFTTHEDKPLRYLIGGSGPPMLLCHGFIGSSENFEDWFSALLPRRTIVAPDLPGFGSSAPLSGGHSASSLARAALSAAADAGVERFDLGGLCLGAPVALAVQRARPKTVDRIVLHTPLLAPWLVRRRYHAQAGVMLSGPVYPLIVWLAHHRVTSDLYKRLMIEGDGVDPKQVEANFANQMRSDPRAAREWLRDGLRRDDVAQVRGSGRRVLILVAAEDRIVNVPQLRRAVAGVPEIELAVVSQGGHAWDAAMIAHQSELLAAFLDGLPLPMRPPESAAA
jgi:pimeloyl-ACP methyl ester carboxylesterase